MSSIYDEMIKKFHEKYGKEAKIEEDDLLVGIFNDGVVLITIDENEKGEPKLVINANVTDSVFKIDENIL